MCLSKMSVYYVCQHDFIGIAAGKTIYVVFGSYQLHKLETKKLNAGLKQLERSDHKPVIADRVHGE